MDSIQILPESVINHIAAGEVIEDPSSVVKELIDNAIDASASKIAVEATMGGFGLISVEDNGNGIAPNQALLVFERHATSKLRTSNELFQIMTMGFRGEAISSIAAISRTNITSYHGGGDAGFSITCEGGRIVSDTPAPPKLGTKIEVTKLFFNTPARKKFQKSAAASLRQLTRMITRLSLAHPEIQFVFRHDGQTHLDSGYEESLSSVIQKVLGKDAFKTMRPLSFNSDLCLEGYIKDPSFMHANRLGQYLSVNKRPVISQEVEDAVREGYSYFIESGKHPSFVLNCSLTPDLVDVNVHPQKKNVRFSEPGKLQETIKKAIFSALEKKRTVSKPSLVSMTDQANDWAFAPSLQFQEPHSTPLMDPSSASVSKPDSSQYTQKAPTFLSTEMRVLGVYQRYFFFENLEEGYFPNALVLLDIHRAHTALAHLKMHKEESINSQALLFSKSYEVSVEEAIFLEQHTDQMISYGLDLSLVGKQRISVVGAPSFINEEEVEHYLFKVLNASMKGETIPYNVISPLGKNSYTVEEAKQVVEMIKQYKLPPVYEGKKIWTHGDESLVKQWIK